MPSNKPTVVAEREIWAMAIKVELDLLVTSLRGGFTAEAVICFGALGVLSQQHPEHSVVLDLNVVTREEAGEFLQILQHSQEKAKHAQI